MLEMPANDYRSEFLRRCRAADLSTDSVTHSVRMCTGGPHGTADYHSEICVIIFCNAEILCMCGARLVLVAMWHASSAPVHFERFRYAAVFDRAAHVSNGRIYGVHAQNGTNSTFELAKRLSLPFKPSESQ